MAGVVVETTKIKEEREALLAQHYLLFITLVASRTGVRTDGTMCVVECRLRNIRFRLTVKCQWYNKVRVDRWNRSAYKSL